VPHTEVFGDFSQLRAPGREETAQQPLAAEPFHPVLPALLAKAQPLEDSGQVRRDRGFTLAKRNQISRGAAKTIVEEIIELISIRPSRLRDAFRLTRLAFCGFA
jgi:hypothetical protein